jgi:hypothetical protein
VNSSEWQMNERNHEIEGRIRERELEGKGEESKK